MTLTFSDSVLLSCLLSQVSVFATVVSWHGWCLLHNSASTANATPSLCKTTLIPFLAPHWQNLSAYLLVKNILDLVERNLQVLPGSASRWWPRRVPIGNRMTLQSDEWRKACDRGLWISALASRCQLYLLQARAFQVSLHFVPFLLKAQVDNCCRQMLKNRIRGSGPFLTRQPLKLLSQICVLYLDMGPRFI